jgi:hypothetical protein
MLALRRGSRRLDWSLSSEGPCNILTKWPEGRRRGRAGGRQEYRHFSSLAQPSRFAPACRHPTGAQFREVRAESLLFRDGLLWYTPVAVLQSIGELASLVDDYQRSGDVGVLLDRLKALAKRTAPDLLKTASQPYRDLPEVVIPLYERIVADAPNDAQAIVVLANAYWLTGRGPDYVDQLASRAKQIDPTNRGAWHLWALAESSVRKRVERWQAVTKQFPGDQLARAALADNATSLANDEEDPVALKLAISTYEGLLAESTHTAQRMALEQSLSALRKWKH